MSRERRTNRRMDELFPQDDPSECRVCTDPVVDGRWSYCSERCRRIARAVQAKFTWSSVREAVLERDDRTCQVCGLSKEMAVRAHWQMRERVDERTEHLRDVGDGMDLWRDRRDELNGVYGCDEYPKFEVDHIRPIGDGGHPPRRGKPADPMQALPQGQDRFGGSGRAARDTARGVHGMRPESERPEAPRCDSCGQFMQQRMSGDRLVVYECCGIERTKFRPQFVAPREAIGQTNNDRDKTYS